jgi:alkyl sulfatase BDS1-like metallo-beta-lactamase superfamily hydrolase
MVNAKDGETVSERSPTYISWMNMIQRCSNAKRDHHNRYIDRGISVCSRWSHFANFLADMGERPHGKSLDRIDNNQGYCKQNCKWSTQTEQCNNTSRNRIVVAFGESKTLAEWARDRRCVVSYHTLKRRLMYGYNHDDAVSLPVRSYRRVEIRRFNGVQPGMMRRMEVLS